MAASKHSARRLAALLIGVGLAWPAWALQSLEVKPDASVMARIALKETSRIKVDGLPIVDVFGSVYAPDNTVGELMVAPDATSGEIYVMPSAAAVPGKPINVFIKTERATYTLLLTPVDIPSETVILSDRVTLAKAQETVPAPSAAPDWLRQIKTMMLVLSGDAKAPGYLSTPVGKPVGLWQEARFFEVRRVANRRLSGSVFDLTNISNAPMVLDPREFIERGVAAVAIESTHLAPNEATRVYVVRENQRGEAR